LFSLLLSFPAALNGECGAAADRESLSRFFTGPLRWPSEARQAYVGWLARKGPCSPKNAL